MTQLATLQVRASIALLEEEKPVWGAMFQVSRLPEAEQRIVARDVDRRFSDMARMAHMTLVNGWLLWDSDGELHCIYCPNKTEGFNHGRHPRRRQPNPVTEPCPCRSLPPSV